MRWVHHVTLWLERVVMETVLNFFSVEVDDVEDEADS